MIFSLISFFLVIYKPYDSWNLTELKNIKIYWQDKVSSIATIFINLAPEELDYLEQFFGREVPQTSIVLFSDYDDTKIEFFFSPSRLFTVNLGGTRIERIFYHINTFEDIVRKVLACAFFTDLPQTIEIVPPSYIVPPEYINAFCDYITLKDDFYNYPFYGSKKSGTIKFIEKEYGKSKIFDIFLNGKILFEDFNIYEKDFLLWRKSRFQYQDYEEDQSSLTLSSKYIHGIHKFGDKIVYFSEGYIKSVDGENILKLDFSEQQFGYMNGDENHIIFDAQDSKFFNIYVISRDLKISKIKLGDTRGWYPDILSDLIVFVKKNIDYDELCVLRKEEKETRKDDNPEYKCLFKTEKYSEIFTPDISPDGSKVAFTIRRSNGFFDVAVFYLDTGKLEFLTQDRFIDIFPKWADESKVIFSSNRSGSFNLFSYDLDSGDFSRITQINEGVFLGMSHTQKVYAVVFQNFSLSLKTLDIKEYEKFIQKRESIYLRFYDQSDSEKVGFSLDKAGLLFPYVYTTLPGFFIGRFVFYVVDDLFRNNIYLGVDWKLPFYRWNSLFSEGTKIYLSSSRLSFFVKGLFRFTNPYIFARLSYNPFDGIFVRILDRGYEFFPERAYHSSLFVIHPFRRALVFWGIELSHYSLYDELPSVDFWNMVKREYTNFGSGLFLNPNIGLLLRTAKKSFHLENGVDLFISSTFTTRKFGSTSKLSLNFFSPRLIFLILNLGVNAFVSSNVPRRFHETFGSKEIPPYIDPPYDLSPIRNFSPVSFDFKYLGYDVGDIKGVRPRRSQIGFVGNARTYINVLHFDFTSPIDIDFVNIIPFLSYGGFRNVLTNNFDFLYSYGGELDIQTKVFYSLPLTLKLGIARGEVTELYFALFLTPGSLRD